MVAGVGVVVTAKLAIDAHDKCIVDKERLLDIPREERTDEVKKDYKVRAFQHYILPVTVGVATIGCILGIRILDIRTEKNLVSAALLGETMLQKYETRINEEFGPEKAVEIRKDVVGELYTGLTEDIHQSYSSRFSRMNCYDPYSDTYFKASQSELLLAEIEINNHIINGGGISIVDYMKQFGVDISDKYPDDPDKIPGWYCDDNYCWNSSFYGYYVALSPMITDIKGKGETMVINVSHDPIEPDEGFLYG